MRDRGWGHLPRSNSLVLPHLISGGIRPAGIAKKAGVTRQAVHQVVDGLANLGLIEIKADPIDRRSNLVVITSRGHKFEAAVQEVSTEIEELLAARIGPAAVSNLRIGLGADWDDPSLEHPGHLSTFGGYDTKLEHSAHTHHIPEGKDHESVA